MYKRQERAETERMLEAQSQELSTVRQEAAGVLVDRIRQGLEDLNFIDVRFDMKFEKLDHYTSGGYDEAELLISTNPGEPVRPLGMVASGGELSRIMLAIKACLLYTSYRLKLKMYHPERQLRDRRQHLVELEDRMKTIMERNLSLIHI